MRARLPSHSVAAAPPGSDDGSSSPTPDISISDAGDDAGNVTSARCSVRDSRLALAENERQEKKEAVKTTPFVASLGQNAAAHPAHPASADAMAPRMSQQAERKQESCSNSSTTVCTTSIAAREPGGVLGSCDGGRRPSSRAGKMRIVPTCRYPAKMRRPMHFCIDCSATGPAGP